MNLAELLPEDHVICALRAADKAQLLQELARRAAAASNVPQKQILAALESREKLGSTGLGRGFALPHARLEGLGRFFALFAKLARQIGYDAVDEKPVDLVFLLLTPPGASSEAMTIMASVVRRIRDPQFASRLRKAESAAALHALLTFTEL
jgi:PTS system nitrogen regulatory IIA component